MLSTRVSVNPDLLDWALERAGVSTDALEAKFPKLREWLTGELAPTLKQLEAFAAATHTAIGLLLLSQPPDEPLPIPDFRTLPQARLSRPSASLHAKNFSVLYAGRAAVLAPLYDVLSTAVYPTLTPKMAMKIGSKYKFSEVEARHWNQFAEAVGLGKAQARKRILALAKSMPPTARALQSSHGHGFAGHAVVDQVVALIEQRCALTLRRLSGSESVEDATGSAT